MSNNEFIKVNTVYNSEITIPTSEIRFVAPYIDEIKGCCFDLFNNKQKFDNSSLYQIDEKFTSPTQHIISLSVPNLNVKAYIKLKDGTLIECVEDYNNINKKLGL